MQNSNEEKNDRDKKFKLFLKYISSQILDSEEQYLKLGMFIAMAIDILIHLSPHFS